MTRNTIDRDGITSQDVRYFIFNFKLDVMTFCHSVRGHWSAESMHWLLDVVYREDHHQTLDKRAAFNLNLIRKMCLYFLKKTSAIDANNGISLSIWKIIWKQRLGK